MPDRAEPPLVPSLRTLAATFSGRHPVRFKGQEKLCLGEGSPMCRSSSRALMSA